MKRRMLATLALALAGAVGALPASASAQTGKTLKMVAHADLKILDPSFTTAYITRNFGFAPGHGLNLLDRTDIPGI